jgi:hypothetical protein
LVGLHVVCTPTGCAYSVGLTIRLLIQPTKLDGTQWNPGGGDFDYPEFRFL